MVAGMGVGGKTDNEEGSLDPGIPVAWSWQHRGGAWAARAARAEPSQAAGVPDPSAPLPGRKGRGGEAATGSGVGADCATGQERKGKSRGWEGTRGGPDMPQLEAEWQPQLQVVPHGPRGLQRPIGPGPQGILHGAQGEQRAQGPHRPGREQGQGWRKGGEQGQKGMEEVEQSRGLPAPFGVSCWQWQGKAASVSLQGAHSSPPQATGRSPSMKSLNSRSSPVRSPLRILPRGPMHSPMQMPSGQACVGVGEGDQGSGEEVEGGGEAPKRGVRPTHRERPLFK